MEFVFYMGVSKNRGTQNGWSIMENPIKIDDLGGPPLFLETPMFYSEILQFQNRQISRFPVPYLEAFELVGDGLAVRERRFYAMKRTWICLYKI